MRRRAARCARRSRAGTRANAGSASPERRGPPIARRQRAASRPRHARSCRRRRRRWRRRCASRRRAMRQGRAAFSSTGRAAPKGAAHRTDRHAGSGQAIVNRRYGPGRAVPGTWPPRRETAPMPHNGTFHDYGRDRHAQDRDGDGWTRARRVGVPAAAQTKVAIGYSGWTGFAPLTLAKEAGIFKKNGLDVDLKKIPQKDRHLAIASGDVQCAATTVETWVVWNANGVADEADLPDGQELRRRRHGRAQQRREDRRPQGQDGRRSAPGTAPYFTLAWFLKKNGLSVKDVTVVNLEPGRGGAGVRRRPERRRDDLRAVSVDGARQSRRPARSSRRRSTTRWSWTRSAARRSSSPTIRRPRRRWPTATSRRSR